MYRVCLAKLGYAIAAATGLFGACISTQAENLALQLSVLPHHYTNTTAKCHIKFETSEVRTFEIRRRWSDAD